MAAGFRRSTSTERVNGRLRAKLSPELLFDRKLGSRRMALAARTSVLRTGWRAPWTVTFLTRVVGTADVLALPGSPDPFVGKFRETSRDHSGRSRTIGLALTPGSYPSHSYHCRVAGCRCPEESPRERGRCRRTLAGIN